MLRLPELPAYLFVVCQRGAEAALKAEVQRQWPDFRLSFSRPGFVTFKVADPAAFDAAEFDLRSTFARCYGFSLGKLVGEAAEEMAARVWSLAGDHPFAHLHVWQRDTQVPGSKGFEPGITPLAADVARQVAAHCPLERAPEVNRTARAGQLVLDCVLVEPNEWWLGFHVARTVPTRWPGGVCPLEPAEQMVSRAYLKMHEALLWSELPAAPGDVCAEIGCAPGGAAQALLERGLHVLGIDPAEVDPVVRAHPHFQHIRKRAADMKRREFAEVRWLVSDSNVMPNYTLDAVEAIVTHEAVRVRGLLLTLKLATWKLADELPNYAERVRSWGYKDVRFRQLAFNRREVCMAAMRSRAQRRLRTRSKAR